MKIFGYAIALMIGILAIASQALAGQEDAPYVGSRPFEQLKQLVGRWD